MAVKVKKDGDAWKLDIGLSQPQQLAVNRLMTNDRYKDYANRFKILSGDIKRDRTVKEDVKARLKELLEKAAAD